MLRRKLAESLTARVFLITALILLGAGTVTFGLIAWATPSTYTAIANDDLRKQVAALAEELAKTNFEDFGAVLDDFIRTTRADAFLLTPDGNMADTDSLLSAHPQYANDRIAVYVGGEEEAEYISGAGWEGDIPEYTVREDSGNSASLASSRQDTIFTEVSFADRPELYGLYVTPRAVEENLAVRALIRMAPWLLLALLAFSLLCAFVYSRYITRPIVRLSGIAKQIARLNFDWICHNSRRDEIGALGRSLDEMGKRLAAALSELETANQALRGEVERERERERQRTAFFSAASHELKTPVTILKGQLTGMLEGVGVYRNRDKYLLRSLQVAGRMEHLIQEMLTISRMEAKATGGAMETVDLSALTERQLALEGELAEQRGQRLISRLTPKTMVTGNPALLEKVVGNLLSNAILYSPEGARITVWCGMDQGRPALTVENTNAHISEEALPHLFEAFYREERSRNRDTGGSGLGLFLAGMILERHQASCSIVNTEEGVRAVIRFPSRESLPPPQVSHKV